MLLVTWAGWQELISKYWFRSVGFFILMIIRNNNWATPEVHLSWDALGPFSTGLQSEHMMSYCQDSPGPTLGVVLWLAVQFSIRIMSLQMSWAWETQYRRFTVHWDFILTHLAGPTVHTASPGVRTTSSTLTQHTVCHQATRQVCAILYCSLSWHFYHQCNLCDVQCSTRFITKETELWWTATNVNSWY